MNISIIFIVTVTIFTVQAEYRPPRSFCDSISRFCKEHPYCAPAEEEVTSAPEPPKKGEAAENPTDDRKKREDGSTTSNTTTEAPPPEEEKEPYEYDSFLKEKFVRMVNYVRNEVACGEPALVNFANQTLPKAAKMQEVAWDEELEWAAGLFLKNSDIPDECKVTPSYRNLVEVKDTEAKLFLFEHYSKLWYYLVDLFPSFVFLSAKAIEVYGDDDNDFLEVPKYKDPFLEQVGGLEGDIEKAKMLINILNERVSKMGCATVHMSNETGKINLNTLCLLSENITRGAPVYKSSMVPGSGCERLHPEMKCLCGIEEEVTTIKPPVNNMPTTNMPIRPKPWEHVHVERHRPTCPTVIRVLKTTRPPIFRPPKVLVEPPIKKTVIVRTSTEPTIIPYCDEEDEEESLGTKIHLSGIICIGLVGFYILI